MLNELDKELEKRGLQFVRYADDCVILTKSRKSAERVMENITKFIETKLRLKVNKDKSKIDRPWRIKYLGFSFYQAKGKVEIRIHPKSVAKFKDKIRVITSSINDNIRMYKKSKITMYKHTFFFVYFLLEVYKNGKINSSIKDFERNEIKAKLFSIS